MTIEQLKPEQLEQFRGLSTCIVASAIESFRVRLPNVGFADSTIQCVFRDQPPVAGYAATARIRTANPPMQGWGYNYERSDWWNHILSIPAPRVVVLEDLDDPPGLGAFVGEVYANILRALGCVGVVTNAGVRDVPDVQLTGLQMFARNVSVSHGYAHILNFGTPVVVGGLKVGPGDLIHGDRHGVQTIPLEIADKVPAAAHEIVQRRQRLISVCRSAGFTTERLRTAIKDTKLNHEDTES